MRVLIDFGTKYVGIEVTKVSQLGVYCQYDCVNFVLPVYSRDLFFIWSGFSMQ